jgi:3-isopropylmalate dehydratase small subunit
VNQGLPIIILPDAVDNLRQGDAITIDFQEGTVTVNETKFHFDPLPDKLMKIFDAKGLVNYIKSSA